MSGRYGPNTAQVERFLERVADLPDDHWRRLAGHLSDRAERRPGPDEVLLTLDSQHGSDRGDLDVPESESPRVDAAVRKAAKALQYRDLLAPHDFDSLYAAFASIIPVETLEDYDVVGKALDDEGLLDPLLRTLWRRFRLRARQR
jgi:hypothetical protein